MKEINVTKKQLEDAGLKALHEMADECLEEKIPEMGLLQAIIVGDFVRRLCRDLFGGGVRPQLMRINA